MAEEILLLTQAGGPQTLSLSSTRKRLVHRGFVPMKQEVQLLGTMGE